MNQGPRVNEVPPRAQPVPPIVPPVPEAQPEVQPEVQPEIPQNVNIPMAPVGRQVNLQPVREDLFHGLAGFCDRVSYNVLQQRDPCRSTGRIHELQTRVDDGNGGRKGV
ncbi:hypothetical protein TIFTF001_050379 [Ficus carica]|uniref:Uncharacterized protein n=1 Tax=Ficus carica TaxID=3494 RepID=A0AA87YZB1_FICCA|nr:hypothetical protein TIFTF001_050379 [Ficus carica]